MRIMFWIPMYQQAKQSQTGMSLNYWPTVPFLSYHFYVSTTNMTQHNARNSTTNSYHTSHLSLQDLFHL